jgi:hypothetical protein
MKCEAIMAVMGHLRVAGGGDLVAVHQTVCRVLH